MQYTSVGWISAGALILLPFLPWFGFLSGPVSSKYFLLIALVDLCVLGYAASVYRERMVPHGVKRPLLASLGLLLCVLFVSSLSGIHPAHSLWSDVGRMTGLFFLAHIFVWAVVMAECMSQKDFVLVRRAVGVTAGLYALLTSIGAAGFGYLGHFLWLDLSKYDPSFGNETYAGMYLVLAAGIAAIEWVRTSSRRWKFVMGASILCIATSPMLLNIQSLLGFQGATDIANSMYGLSRASSTSFWVAVVFLLGLWALSKIPAERIRRTLKTIWIIVAAGGVLVGFVLFITSGSFVQSAYTDRTTESRFSVWEALPEQIADKPLLGVGPENFYSVFESGVNPSLYAKEGRIFWFDRAHNVVFDTLVTSGSIGALAYLFVIGAYVFTVLRAFRKALLSANEAILWLVLLVAHLAQLQTAFNVIPTYALLAVAGGNILSLERALVPDIRLSKTATRIVACVLCMLALISTLLTFGYELPRQASQTQSLSAQSAAVRTELIETSLSRTSDYQGLYETSMYFVDSVFAAAAHAKDADAIYGVARGYLAQYIDAYETYLADNPTHYRARINYAYILLVATAWGGEDPVDEALAYLADSYRYSPNNPLTPALEVLGYVMKRDMVSAKSAHTRMQTLLPEGKLTQALGQWLAEEERRPSARPFFRVDSL